VAAALPACGLVRADPPRPEAERQPELWTFCPATGGGPCAELGGPSQGPVGRTVRPDGAPDPPDRTPFTTLQLNLCNSGLAACYATLNNGRAVPEAYAAIMALRPQIVTLNEVCRDDVVTGLYPALARGFPGDQVFWAFQPTADRLDASRAYRCHNGEPYGVGILGRVRAESWAGLSVFNGLYPQQGDGPDELRVWLCVAAIANYYACTTHLTFASASVAFRQCRHLLHVEIPAMRTAVGSAAPVLVAGDLNLRDGGTPDVRDCVPAGYRHLGDGDVQHLIVSGDLDLGPARRYPMRHTDHSGWHVSVAP